MEACRRLICLQDELVYSRGLICSCCFEIWIKSDQHTDPRTGWNHWFEQFVEGRVQRGDWFLHVLSWWEHCDNDNIPFLKYEDLKKDTASVLRSIAAFLKIELSADKINEIVEGSNFQTMKSDDVLGDVKEFNQFFRKGKVGSWKEQFTVAQNEFFDELCREKFAGSGLSFD